MFKQRRLSRSTPNLYSVAEEPCEEEGHASFLPPISSPRQPPVTPALPPAHSVKRMMRKAHSLPMGFTGAPATAMTPFVAEEYEPRLKTGIPHGLEPIPQAVLARTQDTRASPRSPRFCFTNHSYLNLFVFSLHPCQCRDAFTLLEHGPLGMLA